MTLTGLCCKFELLKQFTMANLHTFRIERTEGWIYPGGAYDITLTGKIDLHCKDHGNYLGVTTVTARKRKINSDEIVPEISIRTQVVPEPLCDCQITYEKVNFDFSSLDEPYKSAFEDVFTNSKWGVEEKLKKYRDCNINFSLLTTNL